MKRNFWVDRIWTTEQLMEMWTTVSTEINGKWVPARPENTSRYLMPLTMRIRRAWAVFTCRADAFVWPQDE